MTLPTRNETDPNAPHHFQLNGYIVRRGPGQGMHYGKCRLCDHYLVHDLHDYEDPLFAEAEAARMRAHPSG